MKRLFYLAVGFMAFGLAACNSELGPEYTTMPTIDNLSISPLIVKLSENDTVEPVYEYRDVMLTCYFTNTYGWSQIYLYYRTLTPEEYEGKSDNEVQQLWTTKFSSNDEMYNSMNISKLFETAPVATQYFFATIPGQPAGTRVRWDFGYFNQYGLGSGYLASGLLPRNEYTVIAEGVSELPDEE